MNFCSTKTILENDIQAEVVAHAFHPSIQDQRHVDLCAQVHFCLQSKFQNSQCYILRPWLKGKKRYYLVFLKTF